MGTEGVWVLSEILLVGAVCLRQDVPEYPCLLIVCAWISICVPLWEHTRTYVLIKTSLCSYSWMWRIKTPLTSVLWSLVKKWVGESAIMWHAAVGSLLICYSEWTVMEWLPPRVTCSAAGCLGWGGDTLTKCCLKSKFIGLESLACLGWISPKGDNKDLTHQMLVTQWNPSQGDNVEVELKGCVKWGPVVHEPWQYQRIVLLLLELSTFFTPRRNSSPDQPLYCALFWVFFFVLFCKIEPFWDMFLYLSGNITTNIVLLLQIFV